jgi:tripartite-type tricarboxylate transporter receptor subunit TctC
VAQPPGGGTDTIARLIADRLSKQLGQTFIVENRPGAGMNVGTEAVARADADGYSLLLGLNGNMAVNPSLFSNLRYDPIRDFTPVAMLANYPFLLVANKDFPAKSVKDLIDMAKAKPGTINYASAGNGTGQQLAMELFKMLTGTNFTHVPYRGAQAAYIDVFSGQVPIFFDNISTAAAQVKGGMVRALAITTRERSKLLPDLPTLAESGIQAYEYHTWFGLWAPNKTPRPIIEKLNAEVRKALSDPAVIDIIVASAGEPATMPLADIEPFVKAEITKWGEVVKKAGIKIE